MQLKTDLRQTGWTKRGGAIAATDTIMSTSDAIGPDNQRFYRVVPLP
jgi:hypothetical protein